MAFVASQTIAAVVGSNALPSRVDLGGNASPVFLYSHMRIPAGPMIITFDSGQTHNIPIADTTLAIPTGAQSFTSSATGTVQFGQSI